MVLAPGTGSWLISLGRTRMGRLVQLPLGRSQSLAQPLALAGWAAGAAWHNVAHHRMALHGTEWHSTAQHSTAAAPPASHGQPGWHGRNSMGGGTHGFVPALVRLGAPLGPWWAPHLPQGLTLPHSTPASHSLPWAAHAGTKYESHWTGKKWKSSGFISEQYTWIKPQLCTSC